MVQHRELIRAATAILAPYGVPAEIEAEEADARDRVADALITLRARSERHLCEAVCETGFRPGTVGALANQVHAHSRPCLLVMDYVSSATGHHLLSWASRLSIWPATHGSKNRPSSYCQRRVQLSVYSDGPFLS